MKFSLMGVKVWIFLTLGSSCMFFITGKKMISHKIILCSEMTFLVLQCMLKVFSLVGG